MRALYALRSLERSEYAVGDQKKFEVRIKNIGSVPRKSQHKDLDPN
jgi:hypothetical protein